MATKKAPAPAKTSAPKKTAPKTAAKKAPAAKKPAAKGAIKTAATPAAKKTSSVKGNKYSCETCGLILTVDKACGCVELCEIICCDAPMKISK